MKTPLTFFWTTLFPTTPSLTLFWPTQPSLTSLSRPSISVCKKHPSLLRCREEYCLPPCPTMVLMQPQLCLIRRVRICQISGQSPGHSHQLAPCCLGKASHLPGKQLRSPWVRRGRGSSTKDRQQVICSITCTMPTEQGCL